MSNIELAVLPVCTTMLLLASSIRSTQDHAPQTYATADAQSCVKQCEDLHLSLHAAGMSAPAELLQI
jgi:hypothetical protein